jgi:N4-gp56 family major capsid protein
MQAMPGSSVVFQRYQNLAQATSALSEDVDPDAVALGNTLTVTVTLNEYGNVVLESQKLEALALTDVDPAIANIVAYNCADSVDQLAQNTLALGTNSIVTSGSNSATIAVATSAPATARASVTNVGNNSTLSSVAVRRAVIEMRTANVQPTKGTLYGCAVHPRVAADLRTETGSNLWRDPHVYSAPDAIWAAELGEYEGAYFIENPRCNNATVGVSSARVFNTYFMGRQALAEGVGYEPTIVVGPIVDKLMRARPIGWKALLGWAVYRQQSLWQVFTSANTQLT